MSTPDNLKPTIAPLVRAVVGKVADWKPRPEVTVEVIIEDVRNNWGRIDYLITPVAGTGYIWTQSQMVDIRVSV